MDTKIDDLTTTMDNVSLEQEGKEVSPPLPEMFYILDGINFPTNGRRLGFPKFKGGILGTSQHRCRQYPPNLSNLSKKHTAEWDFIKNWSYDNVPPEIEWNCIQVNKNLVCPAHRDKANIGNSFIIAFGDYVGCNLVVEDLSGNEVEHDIRTGLVYNGYIQRHYNTPLISGTKYTLVFFKNKLPHFSEFEFPEKEDPKGDPSNPLATHVAPDDDDEDCGDL